MKRRIRSLTLKPSGLIPDDNSSTTEIEKQVRPHKRAFTQTGRSIEVDGYTLATAEA